MRNMLPGPRRQVTISLFGARLCVPEGTSIAASMMLSGSLSTQPEDELRPRAPYCLVGNCFECLVRVEGQDVRACMAEVAEGMVIDYAHTGS